METYHLAWLTIHPHRSQDWLKAMLRDGFDVHHIDGNHQNDDPANLALIEHTDHMRLHGMGNGLGRLAPRRPVKSIKPRRVTRKGKAKANAIYEATKESLAAKHSPVRTPPQTSLPDSSLSGYPYDSTNWRPWHSRT